MTEQNPAPEPEETEAAEVEAHSAGAVLGLQKMDAKSAGSLGVAFSASSCVADSCNRDAL